MTRVQMRKRKYHQSKEQSFCQDFLTESIDEYYKRLKQCDDIALPTNSCNIPKTFIHNLVGTSKIQIQHKWLDLKAVSQCMPNTSYDKQKFAAITVRLYSPVCTVLLFSSGKMVITGCKSYVQCIAAAYEIVSTLQQTYPYERVGLAEVIIQNIVGNADINLKADDYIDLDGMMREHNIFCTYLKNMFPGLIYRPQNSPVVLLIFLSGKVVITGGRSCHDVEYGWKQLWPTIQKFIKKK